MDSQKVKNVFSEIYSHGFEIAKKEEVDLRKVVMTRDCVSITFYDQDLQFDVTYTWRRNEKL